MLSETQWLSGWEIRQRWAHDHAPPIARIMRARTATPTVTLRALVRAGLAYRRTTGRIAFATDEYRRSPAGTTALAEGGDGA